MEGAVVLGDPHRAPTVAEILDLLKPPTQNLVVNLLGVALEHRPGFFQELLPQLQSLRAHMGRPHWIVVDEAHHLLPRSWDPAVLTLPRELRGLLAITVHPENLATSVLSSVDLLLAVGDDPDRTIGALCRATDEHAPASVPSNLKQGEAVAWWRSRSAAPIKVRIAPPKAEHSRHSRKYAEGSLGPERSFRFRGPEGKLNLRAQNLVLFLQMAEGVDDDTWLFHLRNGDYSRWFRDGVKDEALAAAGEQIERELRGASAGKSREAIREAIEERYTLPSDQPTGEITAERPSPET
jgi:hypothetical protein